MSRILHIDMDAFFVSVETFKNPSLKGHPVAVGNPGPRGVISSASYEARKFGVRSAMPSSRARRLCPNIIIIPGNHAAYSSCSRRIRQLLEHFSPRVEPASIDEFSLDLSGCQRIHGNFFALACKLYRLIHETLGISASIGLGANRTIAKIASKIAKPRGILEVLEGSEESFMAALPVRLIPGVGPKAGNILLRMGIKTAGDLVSVPPILVEKTIGACGLELHLKARGLWQGSSIEGHRQPKTIGHETTFAMDTVDPIVIETTLFNLVEKSVFRLRCQELEATRVTVKVRYSNFSTSSRTRAMEGTSTEQHVFRQALPALESLTRRRLRVRLLGVSLSGLYPRGYQEYLFRGTFDTKRHDACRCLDRLKKKFGSTSVRWAAGVIHS